MANNLIDPNGLTIQATNATGADVVSGEPFLAGATVVVASVDIANTATGTARCLGVFSLNKEAAVALAAGDKVNLVTGTDTFGTTAGAAAGIAAADAAEGDAMVEVNLNVNP